MNTFYSVFLTTAAESAKTNTTSFTIWIPAITSIVTFLINMLFYIFGQPKIAFKLKRPAS